MRPSDLYKLPDLKSEPWHDGNDTIIKLSTGYDLWSELDHSRAKVENDTAVMISEKLSCFFDYGERTASVNVISFEGKPFGYTATAGRSEQDYQEFVCTDTVTRDLAMAHLRNFMHRDHEFETLDEDVDDPSIDYFYGASTAVADDGTVVLVRDDRLADDRSLVFDDRLFNSAFDRLVRPYYTARGFADDSAREALAEAIVEAIPERFSPTKINHTTERGDWIGAVLSTAEGSYGLTLPAYVRNAVGFSGISSLSSHRLGGPEVADNLIAQYRSDSPKPS